MKISIIVAAATNNVIGRDGRLPWHLSEDLKRFKRLTTGKSIIMGRRTYESIGKPLADRRNIVISGRENLEIDGCEVVASPDAAIALTADDDEVMVIGGGNIYEQILPMADRIYLTRIHASFEGDIFFPEISNEEWQVVDEENFAADESRDFGFSFLTLNRIGDRK